MLRRLFHKIVSAETVEGTGETDPALRKRLVLTGALGAVGGAALTVLLLFLAYLATGGGGRPVREITRVPQKVEARVRPTTPGMVETRKAPKYQRPEPKEEGRLARKSDKIPISAVTPVKPKPPKAAVIPAKPKQEPVKQKQERPVRAEKVTAQLPDTPSKKQEKVSETRPVPRGPWVINLTSLSSKLEAQRFRDNLKQGGYNAYVAEWKRGDKVWYRVRVGFFLTREEAERAAQGIEKRYHFKDYWVTQEPKD